MLMASLSLEVCIMVLIDGTFAIACNRVQIVAVTTSNLYGVARYGC